jgi:hypothetical protein
VKGIILPEFVPPKQSTKHPEFKFWNIYSNAVVKSLVRQVDFAS